MTASLVIDILGAVNQRQPNEPVLFHSDRARRYTLVAFRQFLGPHNLVAFYSKRDGPLILLKKFLFQPSLISKTEIITDVSIRTIKCCPLIKNENNFIKSNFL